MKKIIAGMMIVSSIVCAASIDVAKAQVKWTAFKTPAKIAVGGSFDDVKFKFGTPNKTQSLESQLNNATATIDIMKVNTADAGRDETLRKSFFEHFNKKDPIKVTFKDVIEGKGKGTILANVRMNGKTQKVPMQYEIAGGKIIAKGVLDLSLFGLENARASLQNAVKDLHENLTWSQVEIAFEAPVK
ncbi:YceI family protein [Helicobacter sp. MIT 21-1697]|uniref:YceI family protein n=1 Tax=Helicobacter sp. MIT 21-1697 TaxID=2993733 RepID=UPI00224B339C|nr:YceI family protein [Helicobacter sp. MIT 21-1697]MCX2716128.1 YceI family protein [Helicobacter sp. MIT 21-1697]